MWEYKPKILTDTVTRTACCRKVTHQALLNAVTGHQVASMSGYPILDSGIDARQQVTGTYPKLAVRQ
jgi:hypothetical protein